MSEDNKKVNEEIKEEEFKAGKAEGIAEGKAAGIAEGKAAGIAEDTEMINNIYNVKITDFITDDIMKVSLV